MKIFFLKKALSKKLNDVKHESLLYPINRVGLIVDENHFLEINKLKQEIILNGIAKDSIDIIVYNNSTKRKEEVDFSVFNLKDVNYKGEFTATFLNQFIAEEFDLLISYYDKSDPFLLLLTNNSNAKFKVGFLTIGKRLNHLLINIDLANYKGFTDELFKYLKILNKI